MKTWQTTRKRMARGVAALVCALMLLVAGQIWASPSWSFVTTEPEGSGNLFILY